VGSYDQTLRVLNHLTWKTFAEFMHPYAVRGPCYAAVFKVFLFDTFIVDGVAVYENFIYHVPEIAGSR
jgi:hypothetical protein